MEGTEQRSAEALAAFGRHLVRERELRGLSREEVIRATHLPAAAVEALESGDPARAPHRAYVLGYLRGYAAAVGLDADDVILRYEEALGPPAEAEPPRPRRLGRWLLLAAAALAAALAAAVAGWGSRRG